MVKITKGGRAMNPADAHRKEQRKKEVARNKLERKYTREAVAQRDNPDEIKKQLKEIIHLEEVTDGKLSKAQKLRKKVLQDAYDHALKRKKEEESKDQAAGAAASSSGVLRPEDSRYYHPTLNPTGAPPPGKLAAGLVGAPVPSKPAIPLPKPPPLPQGPAPKLPPPPAAPPLPGAPPAKVLPPPAGAPPGFPGSQHPPPLPPPSIPPPGWRLPPPAMPPPVVRLAPPTAPPPGAPQAPGPMDEDAAPGTDTPASTASAAPAQAAAMPGPPLAPPLLPPPMLHTLSAPPVLTAGMAPPPAHLPPPTMPPPAAPASAGGPKASATITGESTVVKRPLAHMDKTLTSMVPASVLVRREQAKAKSAAGGAKPAPRPGTVDLGFFGLAPSSRAAVTSAPEPDALAGLPVLRQAAAPAAAAAGAKAQPAAAPVSADAQYQEFLATMKELGAL